MRKILFIFSALVSIVTMGYNVTGVVVDEKGEPLSYATVRVPSLKTGVLCDSVGRFMLEVDKLRAKDSLKISYLGYITRRLAPGYESDTITLLPDITGIPEVVVVPKDKVKKRKAGKKHGWALLNLTGCIDGPTAGDSYGYEFHVKKGKELVLYKVGFFYCDGPKKPQMTKMKFRINVYDMSNVKDDWTKDLIPAIPEPIYFDFELGEEKKGKFEYILPESILLPRDAMVEIEMLENLEDEMFYFKSNLFGRSIWSRSLEENFWCKNPFAAPFFVECLEMEAR